MATERAMTREQIETFKREGAVLLKRFIAPEQLAAWTSEYWDFMGASPDEPRSWPGTPRFDLGRHFNTQHATNLGGQEPGSLTAGAGWRPGAIAPPDSVAARRLTELPGVQALARQLSGGQASAPFPFDGHLIPRFPQASAWQEPDGTHWDGYGPNGWTGGFNHGFGTVAYLSDVPEKGGGFTYWPGSHRSSHQFFLENPGFIDGSWKADGSRVWKNFWSQEPHASRGGPNSRGKGVQVVGEAGDLLVWHGWLIHSGSQNACTFPRLALLGSFRNTAMADSGPPVFFDAKKGYRESPDMSELRYVVPQMHDHWHFWGEDVKNCGGDVDPWTEQSYSSDSATLVSKL